MLPEWLRVLPTESDPGLARPCRSQGRPSRRAQGPPGPQAARRPSGFHPAGARLPSQALAGTWAGVRLWDPEDRCRAGLRTESGPTGCVEAGSRGLGLRTPSQTCTTAREPAHHVCEGALGGAGARVWHRSTRRPRDVEKGTRTRRRQQTLKELTQTQPDTLSAETRKQLRKSYRLPRPTRQRKPVLEQQRGPAARGTVRARDEHRGHPTATGQERSGCGYRDLGNTEEPGLFLSRCGP